ncbi:uncharacterized protein LOC128718499 [Anopheles marshallii]|uniref:uncharacterized protein LOC128718499 n=1 Tax=Anopheles marshallii TaxID=1521116 RepID=UPI00237C468B|nr:uncharacterized protein LOC128718499 [Anopheles marshallii]
MMQLGWTASVFMALLTFANHADCFVTIIPVINRMECKFDERFVNLTCSLTEPNSATNQSVSLDVEVVREVREVKLTVAYYTVTGGTVNRILQRTVDLCSYVRRPGIDRLVKVIYDHMQLNNRFVTGCPIAENEKFHLHNIRPSAIRVPDFLPESNFIFETSYYTGVLFEPVVEVRYYGRLTRVANDLPNYSSITPGA